MRSYVFSTVFVGVLALQPAHSAFDEISSVANHCLDNKNSIKLSQDRTVLCFDGEIRPDRDTSAFDQLKQDGFFVVRSPGGYGLTAMKLANTLREKNATIVIYDYCLSACANYFLIASSKTYVLKNAIVAWHGGPRKIDCSPSGLEHLRKYFAENLERLRTEYKERYPQGPESVLSPEWICEENELLSLFFRQRGIDDRHIYGPQTPYTKKFVNVAVKQVINKRSAFWMWNPRNYGDYFKSLITFEAYPDSQDEVDEILTRSGFGSGRVFYDPPRFHDPPR
jgi:hypothetical protein